jgi:sigma-B regulation protein RsbU (phosphoserine phosphatase)
VTLSNSGLPYPIRLRRPDRQDAATCAKSIELAGVPLGSFPGTLYDEVSFDLAAGDVYVFCSDGVFEARDGHGEEFGSTRLRAVLERLYETDAREMVDGIFLAVQDFRGETPANDDMTAVVLRVTS